MDFPGIEILPCANGILVRETGSDRMMATSGHMHVFNDLMEFFMWFQSYATTEPGSHRMVDKKPTPRKDALTTENMRRIIDAMQEKAITPMTTGPGTIIPDVYQKKIRDDWVDSIAKIDPGSILKTNEGV